MRYENAAIPTGLAWSSPFTRCQGSLAGVVQPGPGRRRPPGSARSRDLNEEPRQRGADLFTGRARGDTGAAAVIRVDD